MAAVEKFDNEIIFKAIDKIIEISKYLPSYAVLNQIKELKFQQQRSRLLMFIGSNFSRRN